MLHVYVLVMILLGDGEAIEKVYFDSLEKCERHASEIKADTPWGLHMRTYCWDAVR